MNPHTYWEDDMKFLLGSRAFDTDTATAAAIHRGVEDSPHHLPGAEQLRFAHVLYRTAKGAFFVHEHGTIKYAKGRPVTSDAAQEMTAQQAVAWIASRGAAILDATGLDLPEEA